MIKTLVKCLKAPNDFWSEGSVYQAFYTESGWGICSNDKNIVWTVKKLDECEYFTADFVPEDEQEEDLSEFEKAVIEIYEGLWEGPVAIEDAKKKAVELFAIAKKEIWKSLPQWEKPIGFKTDTYTCCLGRNGDNRYGLFMPHGFIPTTKLERLPHKE